MPRRLGTNTRAWVYRYLVERDGEACRGCAQEPPLTPLDIDHSNGNAADWDPKNLQLLCRSCNTTKENKARARLHETTALPSPDVTQSPGVGTTEREREPDSPTTRIVKEAVGYQTGSAEMRANHHFEQAFRTWLIAAVREQGHLLKEDAVNAGAELVGCNPTTAKKYLAKLTSSLGPLREATDMLLAVVIVPREPPRPQKAPTTPKPSELPAPSQAHPHQDQRPTQEEAPAPSPRATDQPPGRSLPTPLHQRPHITGGHEPCPRCRNTDRWVAPGLSYDNTCTACGSVKDKQNPLSRRFP